MLSTDTIILAILAATGFVCVVSMLGVFASVMHHETELHDLRNRVAELRYSYTMQIARIHGHITDEDAEPGEVDILDEDPPAMALTTAGARADTPTPSAAAA